MKKQINGCTIVGLSTRTDPSIISKSLQFMAFWSQIKALFMIRCMSVVNVWGKRFKLPQQTHESFLTIDRSFKIFVWYLPNWTSTNLWCVVLYAAYSTRHQRSVEVQFGRYQKNILQGGYMVKKLSCVSCGSLKRFPHTFTIYTRSGAPS